MVDATNAKYPVPTIRIPSGGLKLEKDGFTVNVQYRTNYQNPERGIETM